MIVATMNLQEKLAHVRSDVDRVLRKHRPTMDRLRHELRASRDKSPRLHFLDYRSPALINWLVTLHCAKKIERIYLTAWWHVQGAGLEAFNLAPDGAFYFDTHFFQRYRVRESGQEDVLGNMAQFLLVNHDITMKRLPTERHGLTEVVGVAREGLFLGTERPGNILACDTYLSVDMLRPEQRQLHRLLQYQAATKHWSAVQRQQHIAAIKKEMDRAERLIKKVEEDRARERAEGLEE